MNIGKAIKKIREAKGVSIEDLSYLSGVAFETIESIEGQDDGHGVLVEFFSMTLSRL